MTEKGNSVARRASIEDKLTRISELENSLPSDDATAELRKVLSGANSLLLARAAKVALRCGLADLIPNLVTTLDRLLNKPAKSDPGCLAKLAIAEALDHLESDGADVFLRGIRHVQPEPVYGGSVDTAAEFRGRCGCALARIGYSEALFELTSLLMDPEPQSRLSAARAVAHVGGSESELLLRMKVLAGDEEPNVLGECFSGLLSVNPDRSIDFVSDFLDSDDTAIVEEVVLALGESRTMRAFEILCNYREDNIVDPELREPLLLAMALTRCEEAFEYLLDVIGEEHTENAVAAVTAMHVFHTDDKRRNKIHDAVRRRDESLVTQTWEMQM